MNTVMSLDEYSPVTYFMGEGTGVILIGKIINIYENLEKFHTFQMKNKTGIFFQLQYCSLQKAVLILFEKS